ncbi:MAG: hypothetical protein A3G34_00335 [Candidatus Lindowbacteria bacterium RIFCSPLOWO2_12_FULL_62_27]|nr:MAG: hypothetical protein A3G34_00335 [Candidatus Lindowbacteria bacterium RIFCSPLOWO2_12_FULL_62_27]OGH63396.1 MAG: hypothetical protein A3I06_08415 [Candidatus Lindowbacteria bacterium RIFCSPLOWO2_02_FULL_62_12]
MAHLELRNLTKRFNRLTAVDRLNLAVNRGEVYALLGPNGAGKTTTLRMIAGLTPPTSGDILVDGRNLRDHPTEIKSDFFFIPDRPYLYDKLTGREYLEFLINIYGRGRIDAVAGLFREFEIDARLDHLVESYSHGMRQKLLLSAAFMLDPAMLIIDEPLVGLDPKSMVVLRRKIANFAGDNRVAFISTHQLSMAESVATRIGILHHGRLLAEGSVPEIRDRARSGTLEEAFLSLTEEISD